MLIKTIIGLAAFAATASADYCIDPENEGRAKKAVEELDYVKACYTAAGWTSVLLPTEHALDADTKAKLCELQDCHRAMYEFHELMNHGCDFSVHGTTLAILAPTFDSDCTRVPQPVNGPQAELQPANDPQADDDPQPFSDPQPVPAPWHEIPQPECDVVKLLLATDGDDSKQCEVDSRFSFKTATGPPTSDIQALICASSACKSVVAALKDANLPACTTTANIDFLRELVTWFNSDCSQDLWKDDAVSAGVTVDIVP